ncbi:hypothetical protein BDV36DRAFT_308076 [Aspergillus pseudocaelatus]|uniref:FAD-dependent oxidoreductase domain-containing protein 1 n=1 Tax=Aspergillus pseudocaelatus TaxID=1825620 RepID=A0ABQ6WPV8_9EURO|nr:hypothetical protein BDV36DRAFT_308076 [Aspergillus pseudocaelatus]
MSNSNFPSTPSRNHYDVVIIGGATSGSSIAWHLSTNPNFKGSVLVVRANNCMRQQFATVINVKIAQYAADFVKRFGAEFPPNECVPDGPIRTFGYLYLSDSTQFTEVLKKDQQLQASCGAGTQIISTTDIKQKYPFFHTDDIDSGSLNVIDEGAFNALGMDKVRDITLKTGEKVTVGTLVNAAGTGAVTVSRLAGIDLPIEARRRYTYIFSVDEPLPQDLPLTIDPTGFHLRSYRAKDYLVGCPPIGPDTAVGVDDFSFAENAWEEKILLLITRRVPQFSSARVTNAWMGHYEFNTFDHNAIVGAHDKVNNLFFCVGFSGHGSQQAPACGRGVAELIVHGSFQTHHLSVLSYKRIVENQPLTERAVI